MRRYLLACSMLFVFMNAKSTDPGTLSIGTWRAELERADGNAIVFNFQVRDSLGKKILYLCNAAERLLVDSIREKGDSVWIQLPFFESEIRAVRLSQGLLKGAWLKRLTDRYQIMPFEAKLGQNFRFNSTLGLPKVDISGRWSVHFQGDSVWDSTYCVGEFQQHGAELSGTFLNDRGDYRYLQGIVTGDSVQLSCFDGSHAYLFTARATTGGELQEGHYFSGLRYHATWKGQRDPLAKLPDEFGLARMKQGYSSLHFRFRDIDGHWVSIEDPQFKDKVILVQIMGSWCPNCMDETRFLSALYDQYRNKGLEVIGLAFERSADFSRSQASLRTFQERFHVQYPLLITGVTESDPDLSEKTLPELQQIAGFPTTIFINRSGKVEKIHTGFNGPATGPHYEAEKELFTNLVDEMLAGH